MAETLRVGSRVRVQSGSAEGQQGTIVDDFGEQDVTTVVPNGYGKSVSPRRWALALDNGEVAFLNSSDLKATGEVVDVPGQQSQSTGAGGTTPSGSSSGGTSAATTAAAAKPASGSAAQDHGTHGATKSSSDDDVIDAETEEVDETDAGKSDDRSTTPTSGSGSTGRHTSTGSGTDSSKGKSDKDSGGTTS